MSKQEFNKINSFSIRIISDKNIQINMLESEIEDYDLYDYGPDGDEWNEDDQYVYYGYSVSESWFSEGLSDNTDWQPVTKSRENTHNTLLSAGDIFGNTIYTDANDSYPILAHSKYTDSWPKKYNVENGSYESYWPGWYAKEYNYGWVYRFSYKR